MKENTMTLASQVAKESTIKPVAVDMVNHVNINDIIFDGKETKTSISVKLRLLTKLSVTAPFQYFSFITSSLVRLYSSPLHT